MYTVHYLAVSDFWSNSPTVLFILKCEKELEPVIAAKMPAQEFITPYQPSVCDCYLLATFVCQGSRKTNIKA